MTTTAAADRGQTTTAAFQMALLELDRHASGWEIPESSRAPLILIADDMPINAGLAAGILSAEGFRTLVAGDGETARALARKHSPDLILLDVVMPRETGFETCAFLKSDAATAEIPIIFLSALDDVGSKVQGLKNGGVDYVSKPVHAAELLARVRVHLRIRETNRVLAEQQRLRLERLRSAQRAILVRPEDCPGACFAVHYEPLEEAGGDFYDVVQVDDHVFGYFVADVSGHGASAAFLTSAIKALLRQYSGPIYTPEDTMRGIDSVMRQILGDEQYLTACYARLNRLTRQLSIVSAGHPPLVHISRAGQAQTVEMDTEPLGLFNSVVLHRKDLRVAPGDRFFLYTDGLIESEPGWGRAQGMARLVEACKRHRSETLARAVATIAEEGRGAGTTVRDDMLLMAVEVPA